MSGELALDAAVCFAQAASEKSALMLLTLYAKDNVYMRASACAHDGSFANTRSLKSSASATAFAGDPASVDAARARELSRQVVVT